MPRYFAFLRAINVGGHTVKMDRLRLLFEEMGLQNVTTFIASGNVIFDSPFEPPELERVIASSLEKSLGFTVDTFVRTPLELEAIAAHPPFSEEEVAGAATLYVCFLPQTPTAEQARMVSQASTPTQELRVHGRELYWLCRTKISESDVGPAALSRTLGMPTSMRNLNTVRRILAKAEKV